MYVIFLDLGQNCGYTHVVLGRNGAVKVLVQEGNLSQDILPDTGNLAEEEEGEDTGGGTEAAGNAGTVPTRVSHVFPNNTGRSNIARSLSRRINGDSLPNGLARGDSVEVKGGRVPG